MSEPAGPDAGAAASRQARAITGAGIDRVEGRLKVTGKTPYGPRPRWPTLHTR